MTSPLAPRFQNNPQRHAILCARKSSALLLISSLKGPLMSERAQ